jgi:hypothetical protein
MRGDLLIVGDAAAPAGVEEIAGAAMDVVIADIFDKMGGALADLGSITKIVSVVSLLTGLAGAAKFVGVR